jgi:hypothetical protein
MFVRKKRRIIYKQLRAVVGRKKDVVRYKNDK